LLDERAAALRQARLQTGKLYDLFDTAKNLRLTLRGLDRFCTGIMEGEKRAGEEVVSDFLISLAAGYSALPEAFAETLGLYIKLSYGDNNTRVIPFELGRKVALFSGETTLLTNEAARATAHKRSVSERQYKYENWKYFYSARKSARSRREGMKYVIAKAMACRLDGRSPYGFLRHWREGDDGWVAARLIAEREGYSGIGCIYYENYHFGEWYKIEHFAPQIDYPNSCSVDFNPGRPGKESLDVLRRPDNASSYMDSANRREDVVARKKLLQERWSYFSRERPAAARTWGTLDAEPLVSLNARLRPGDVWQGVCRPIVS
jgi:hypothetical protein